MNTKGWDTISIVRQEMINTCWKNQWDETRADFRMDMEEGKASIEGVFESWQIINGGGGKLMRLELPIKEGTYVMGDMKIPLQGMSAIIEVTLSLLPQQDETMLLKSAYCKVAHQKEAIQVDEPGWILPITMLDPEKRLGVYHTVVLDAICQYLLMNPKPFEMLFAKVGFVQNDAPDWVLPKKCTYTYLDTGAVAILAVCTERDISGLPLDVDIPGVLENHESAFVLSPEMVLKHFILPSLMSLYSSCSVGDFTLENKVLLNIKQLSMHSIKSGAIHYTPVVFTRENRSYFSGSQICVNYKGNCNLYAGIDMDWKGEIKISAKLQPDRCITFECQNSHFDHDEKIPWYFKWYISPIVNLIVKIVVSCISDDLIDSIKKCSSQIKVDKLNTVAWCDQTQKVTSAYLSESLVCIY